MDRVEYDPEIDPSIRQAKEEAERERELTERIRIEIERYAREAEAKKEEPEAEADPEKLKEEEELDERARRKQQRDSNLRQKADQRARRAKEGRRAFQSVFTGNILSAEWVRKMLPYLLGFAVLLMLYIANIFHLQRLHRNQQRLEEEIRELSIKAVGYSAEKAQKTQRSAIVKQLEDKNIPLKEFPHPVKIIEAK